MSSVSLVLPDNGTTTLRYIAEDMIRSLAKRTNFPEDYKLVFEEKAGVAIRSESNDNPNTGASTEHTNVIFCQLEERYHIQTTTEKKVGVFAPKPLIHDKMLGIKVTHHGVVCDIVMRLKFRSKSQVLMRSWARGIYMNEKLRNNFFRFDVNYNWDMPKEVFEFLEHAHYLSEKQAGYGRTFDEYLGEVVSERVTKRYNRSGTVSVPVVQELQRDVMGYFSDTEVFNNIAINDDNAEIETEFLTMLPVPASLLINFPIIIHNNFIDKKWRTRWLNLNKPIYVDNTSSPAINHSLYQEKICRFYRGDGGERLIEYDDFFPSDIYKDTRTLLLFPARVDPSDPTHVAELQTLTEDKLHPRILNYMLQNKDTLKKYLAGPYMVELFQIGDREIRPAFTISDDLVIRTDAPMNLRLRYYVRISFVSDQTRLSPETMKRILSDRSNSVNALAALYPDLDPNTILNSTSYDNKLKEYKETWAEFKTLTTRMNGLVAFNNIIIG